MNSKVATSVAFIIGAAVGSIVTWRYSKDVYEKLAQEEIDSVKKAFLRRKNEARFEKEENDVSQEKMNNRQSVDEYVERLKTNGYITRSDISGKEEQKNMAKNKPYVISPEEFGEIEEYETISLTYYSDHVLTDENNEIVEDVDGTVGVDSLTRFGEYEEDSVFVRNDERQCDYEILLDEDPYSSIVNLTPHHTEE